MEFVTCSNLYSLLIIVLGYAITFAFSGPIVRMFIGPPPTGVSDQESKKDGRKKLHDLGAIIGKCENFLAITFILANEVTGLALIFTAKSIIRADDMKKDPRYFLGGTMVNFCFSVLMGFITRLVLIGLA